MKFMNNESLASDLRDLANAKGLQDSLIDTFVTENLPTLALVAATWEKMLDTEPMIATLYEHCRKSDGYVNFFSLYEMAKCLASTCIQYLDKYGALPVPYNRCSPRRLLTILRYPKRMPLVMASWLKREAKEKFFASMYYCDKSQFGYDPRNPDELHSAYARRYLLIEWYRDEIHDILDQILPPVSYFNEDVDPFEFSPGAVSDACTNPICKWFRAEHDFANSMPLPVMEVDPVANRNPIEEFFRGCDSAEERYSLPVYTESYAVRPITVPKQIDAVRTVCPERAYAARLQNHIDKQLRAWWTKRRLDSIFAHNDQDKNRLKAKEGSARGTYASVDISSASDMVHRDLIGAINHPTLNYLVTFMPQAVAWGKEPAYRLQMFGTMGSPLTFDVEMIIFFVMCFVAMVSEQFGKPRIINGKSDPRELGITLVGDDITLPTKYFHILLEVLEQCHFCPNSDKSFGDGHYREACGEEYVDGVRMTGVYYPRGLVISDAIGDVKWDGWKEEYTSPLASLITHHNTLLSEGYSEAASIIMKYLQGSIATGFGLDPTATWNDTIVGNSAYRFESEHGLCDPVVTNRNSLVMSFQPNEYILLHSVCVNWVPTEPKRSCWCADVPKPVFDMISAEWHRYTYDRHEGVLLASHKRGPVLSLPRVSHAHMKPVSSVRLTRHS